MRLRALAFLVDEPRALAVCMYRGTDRLMVRRAAHREIALHTEGDGRSVYLSRSAAARVAFRLLREAAKA